MREIKIRFVDKGDGTVYKPITLVELCRQIEIPRRIILESENGDFVDTDDFLDQFEKGELIAEQYTGLKDKNGKEIYEGDIIRICRSYGYGFLPKGAVAVVSYDENECCYKLKKQGEFRLTSKKMVEVIGNIHENPELLGEEEE